MYLLPVKVPYKKSYLYWDNELEADQSSGDWLFGQNIDNLYTSPVLRTTAQLPGSKWLMYNDQPYEKFTVDRKFFAHAKGIMAYDDESTLSIFHSVPRFPLMDTVKNVKLKASYENQFDTNIPHKAQHFFCSRYGHSVYHHFFIDALFVQQAFITKSNFLPWHDKGMYFSLIPSHHALQKKDDNNNEFEVKTQLYIPKLSKTIQASLYAKFGEEDSDGHRIDLWDGLSKKLNIDNMFLHTWLKSSKDLFQPTATINYIFVMRTPTTAKNFDGDDTKVGKLIWRPSSDHSKWAITPTGVCVGSSNYEDRQSERGGEAICITAPKLRENLFKMIVWVATEDGKQSFDDKFKPSQYIDDEQSGSDWTDNIADYGKFEGIKLTPNPVAKTRDVDYIQRKIVMGIDTSAANQSPLPQASSPLPSSPKQNKNTPSKINSNSPLNRGYPSTPNTADTSLSSTPNTASTPTTPSHFPEFSSPLPSHQKPFHDLAITPSHYIIDETIKTPATGFALIKKNTKTIRVDAELTLNLPLRKADYDAIQQIPELKELKEFEDESEVSFSDFLDSLYTQDASPKITEDKPDLQEDTPDLTENTPTDAEPHENERNSAEQEDYQLRIPPDEPEQDAEEPPKTTDSPDPEKISDWVPKDTFIYVALQNLEAIPIDESGIDTHIDSQVNKDDLNDIDPEEYEPSDDGK